MARKSLHFRLYLIRLPYTLQRPRQKWKGRQSGVEMNSTALPALYADEVYCFYRRLSVKAVARRRLPLLVATETLRLQVNPRTFRRT